jgi:hypothetical protein
MEKMEVPKEVSTIMMDYEWGLIDAFKTTYEDI